MGRLEKPPPKDSILILETTQHLHLPTQLGLPAALQFVQRPDLVLAELDFLAGLQYLPEAQYLPKVTEATVTGVLTLPVPMLGEVTLPFGSLIIIRPDGADLLAQPLAHERAWLAIAGQGKCQETAGQTLWLDYHFQFQAHVQLPDNGQWGAKAFEKMVQATAQRSIARVTEDLPIAFQKALHQAEHMAQVDPTLS